MFVASASIALIVRCVSPAASRADENSDYVAFYEPVAEGILDGRGLTLPDGSLAIRYPPGFPALLAGVFDSGALLGSLAGGDVDWSSFARQRASRRSCCFSSRGQSGPSKGAARGGVFLRHIRFLLWLVKQPSSEMPFVVVSLRGRALPGHRPSPAHSARGARLRSRDRRGHAHSTDRDLSRRSRGGLSLFLRRDTPLRARALVAVLILLGNLLVVMPWEWWLYSQTGKVILVSTGRQEIGP